MEYEQLSGVLASINADNNLDESNIIGKIKEKLGENSDTYREWHNSQFDINHIFNDQFTLLHIAAAIGLAKVAKFLVKNGVMSVKQLQTDVLHYT